MPFDLIPVPFRETVPETVVDRRTGREWTVDVGPFLVAPTVVTVGQWREVAGAGVEGAVHDIEPSLPKVDVSWRDAIRFCNRASEREGLAPVYAIAQRTGDGRPTPSWTPHDEPASDDWIVSRREGAEGYRLLTDAEWQIACRAGSAGPRYGRLDAIAWYDGNSDGRPHPVAQKAPNAWGLFDMLGGVWEWCWDLYDEEVYGPYRIIRGGGWADPEWSCRAGVRRKTNPSSAFDDLGFRLARSLPTS